MGGSAVDGTSLIRVMIASLAFFESRTRMVLDDPGGRGSAFGLMMRQYGIRNRIAHGNLELTRIAVVDFVRDCFTIQVALYRST